MVEGEEHPAPANAASVQQKHPQENSTNSGKAASGGWMASGGGQRGRDSKAWAAGEEEEESKASSQIRDAGMRSRPPQNMYRADGEIGRGRRLMPNNKLRSNTVICRYKPASIPFDTGLDAEFLNLFAKD